MDAEIVCHLCDKKFSNKWTLKRHVKNVHGTDVSQTGENVKSRQICPMEGCSERFPWYYLLKDHLETVHHTSIVVEDIVFASNEDFDNWLHKMEEETTSSYIKNRAANTLADGSKKTTLHCSRSFAPRTKSPDARKRSLQSKGSKKTGILCPSKIEVTTRNDGDEQKIFVKFFQTHFGHTSDLAHLRIDVNSRNIIAGKLHSGITFDKVLSSVRDNKISNISKRAKLVDKKDLHNICRDFKINSSTQRHNNDAISVKLWVKEMESLGDENPVLFFKEQGENHAILNNDNFMLIIMTNFQKIQCKKFSQDKICIDGTHGTNPYDIQLYTLLTVDDFGSGCPIAFCFSNRGDETMFRLFFDYVKGEVGHILANVFMSDDDPVFFNAWASVMPQPVHRLLCSWHVDKCWQKNLSKIKNQEKKSVVYKTLKTLLGVTSSIDEFSELLKQVVINLNQDKDTENFGDYFEKYYASRPECWAYCFRKGVGINTNNHLESFHRNLKHIYLEGKKIKRLDKSIHAVMNVARDSLFKRLIRLVKGNPTERNLKINKSHKTSESIGPELITTVVSQKEWVVKSMSNSSTEYVVSKVQINPCSEPCLRCVSCNICIHSFKCSCTDNIIKLNLCKHIHACSRIFFPTSDPPPQVNPHVNTEIDTLFELTSKSSMDISMYNRVQQKINLLIDLWKPSIESDVGSRVENSIDNIISELSSSSSCSHLVGSPVNTNQKIDKQSRLFSIKKKSNFKKTLKKPTQNEKCNILLGLKDVNQTSINVHTETDHLYCNI